MAINNEKTLKEILYENFQDDESAVYETNHSFPIPPSFLNMFMLFDIILAGAVICFIYFSGMLNNPETSAPIFIFVIFFILVMLLVESVILKNLKQLYPFVVTNKRIIYANFLSFTSQKKNSELFSSIILKDIKSVIIENHKLKITWNNRTDIFKIKDSSEILKEHIDAQISMLK